MNELYRDCVTWIPVAKPSTKLGEIYGFLGGKDSSMLSIRSIASLLESN